MRNSVLAPILSLFCLVPLFGQSPLIIPQVADGAGWQTTIVITNTTANAGNVVVSFQAEIQGALGATQQQNLPVLEGVNLSALPVPAGSSIFLHTPGTAAGLTQGWAQVTAPSGFSAYSVFSYRSGNSQQDATAPAATSAGRILVPFDNTSGLTTAVAVANTDMTNPVTIAVSLRTASGALVQGNLPTVLPGGHQAFLLKDQFTGVAGQSGLAEFYAASGSFAMIALRANPTPAFTSAPVYNEAGPPVISGTSGGGGGSGNIVFGGFAIGKTTTAQGVSESIGGAFGSYTQTEWQLPFSGQTFDRCTVFSYSYGLGALPPTTPDHYLDAGTIAVSGPGLPAGATLNKLTTPNGPAYTYQPTGLVNGGTYTLTGSGGSQVGQFSASATLPSNFTVANWNSISTVNRSQSLPFSWTGTGFDTVSIGITGSSFSTTIQTVSVSCVVPANLGTYSVPAAALALLPQVAAGSFLGTGSLSVSATVNPTGQYSGNLNQATQFTPSLVGGGQVNYGSFSPVVSYSASVSIQ